MVWTDQPAHPLDPSVVPADLPLRVPADFSALTELWEDEQGLMGSSSKRLILFAPDGPGWSDISARLGERGAPPVAGRRRAVGGRLRDDHRLHRQLGVNDSAPRHEPGPVDEAPAPDPVDASEPASADVEPGDPESADAEPGNTADPPLEEPQQELPAPAADLPATGGPALSFGFNLGKIAGQGEDSDPILRDGPDLGLVAVFDGMGGAGGTVYETPDGPRTGAYLASRVARDVVEQRMLELLDPDWNLDGRGRRRRTCSGRSGRRCSSGWWNSRRRQRSALAAAAGPADHDGDGRPATSRAGRRPVVLPRVLGR